ncbi:MAG: DAK2 domain-containing protein, partial [Mesorhizobium sp.]
MTSIDAADLKRMFEAIAVAIEADKDRLCQLDGVIGDADHGIAMALGFGAVRDALAPLELTATEPTVLLNTAAKSFLNAVGASSGPLYAT